MSKLTEKQQQIYDFILDFSQEHGYPPSVREIAQAVESKIPVPPSTFTSRAAPSGTYHPGGRKNPCYFCHRRDPQPPGPGFPCWAMWRPALPFWPRRTLKNT